MRGFTLVELTATTAIITLITFIAVPGFQLFLEAKATDTTIRSLRLTLAQGRNWALNNETSITLCPLLNGRCQSDWSEPLGLFVDSNANLEIDNAEILISQIEQHSPRGHWLKKKADQSYIRFNEQGHAFSSATTFIYCPDSNNLNFARQLVVSFQGRVRTGRYLNSHGEPYANIDPLSCN